MNENVHPKQRSAPSSPLSHLLLTDRPCVTRAGSAAASEPCAGRRVARSAAAGRALHDVAAPRWPNTASLRPPSQWREQASPAIATPTSGPAGLTRRPQTLPPFPAVLALCREVVARATPGTAPRAPPPLVPPTPPGRAGGDRGGEVRGEALRAHAR